MAPALTDSTLDHAMGDVDDARAVAARAARAVDRRARGEAGIEVEASVGDSDLQLAIQDALQTFDADEIVIVAHRDGGAAARAPGDRGGRAAISSRRSPSSSSSTPTDGEPTVAEVEHLPAGQDRADPEEAEPESRNLPPFSPRDLLGIAVAIVGTIVARHPCRRPATTTSRAKTAASPRSRRGS